MDRVYFHYLHIRESIINIFTQYRWQPEIPRSSIKCLPPKVRRATSPGSLSSLAAELCKELK